MPEFGRGAGAQDRIGREKRRSPLNFSKKARNFYYIHFLYRRRAPTVLRVGRSPPLTHLNVQDLLKRSPLTLSKAKNAKIIINL